MHTYQIHDKGIAKILLSSYLFSRNIVAGIAILVHIFFPARILYLYLVPCIWLIGWRERGWPKLAYELSWLWEPVSILLQPSISTTMTYCFLNHRASGTEQQAGRTCSSLLCCSWGGMGEKKGIATGSKVEQMQNSPVNNPHWIITICSMQCFLWKFC